MFVYFLIRGVLTRGCEVVIFRLFSNHRPVGGTGSEGSLMVINTIIVLVLNKTEMQADGNESKLDTVNDPKNNSIGDRIDDSIGNQGEEERRGTGEGQNSTRKGWEWW